MSLEEDELDFALACSADQAEQEAQAGEEVKEDTTLTQVVDAEEFLASEGVPLLEYEKQMFLDLLHTDALVVCAKGISYERVLLNLLKIFCDDSTLVLVVNCSESEEQYYKTNLEHTEHIHESAKLSTERERAYLQGGIQFISTRILVVDLLKNRIPIELITGMFVVRAHEIIESCQEAFALRLYRQRNKVGFVKAFSRNVEAFTYGYGHVEKVMRNLFVKELFIWPRFHMTIQRSLRPFEPAVVELQIPMTQNMILLQTHLLDLMNYLVKSIKSLNRFVELQEVTVENCVTKKFHKILQAQLDTIWHQLSSQTKLIVADLKVLRSLMISCLYGDSVSFYALLKRYRTTEYALNNSGWTILDAAEKVFTLAKERVYNRENEFEPELCPKWKALSDVLRVDIPNEIKETAKKIRKKEERQKFLQQQVKILILCQDPRACYQLNQFLTQGPQRYLFYQALKNDLSVAKLSDDFKHIPSEVDVAGFRIQEFVPVAKAPAKAAPMGPPPAVSAKPEEAAGSSKAKGCFLRERIAKKRAEVAEELEARKRKEKEEEELGTEGEAEGPKKSDMEAELAATAAARTEEADYQRYFRDSYVLTMSQRVPEDVPDASPDFDVSVLESGTFEPFTEMENMDITTMVKDLQRPLVFIQTFKSEGNGLGSLDRTLEQIHPRYIVMYHTNVTAIRQIEVYEARQQRKEMARVRVYAIIHSKTVEEQAYLTSLRREKQAFELLIDTKRTMVVPEYQDGKSEDTILMLQKKQELSSRQAGGQEVKDAGESVTPRVIVDMREFRSDLPCLIHRRGIDVVPLTITIGDYILTPEICVERKSISDLIGSLNSGRLYNQCVQMSRFYAKPILLIEFDQNKPFHFQRYFMASGGGGSSSSVGSSNEDIMAKLQLLTIHFPKLRLVWSPSPYSTAQLFEELKQGKGEPDPDVAVKVGTDDTAGEEPEGTDTAALLLNVDVQEFLTKLPGITSRNVGKIMRQCRSLRELTQKSEGELEELLGGQALAKQLWDILHTVHKPAQPNANDKPYSAKFKRGGRKM